MITDEELDGLPEDPELAFLAFERVLRDRYYDSLFEANSPTLVELQREYMSAVVAAASEFGVDPIAEKVIPPIRHLDFESFQQFLSDIDYVTTRLRIRHRTPDRQNSVGLDPNVKRRIHHYISQIRNVIDEAQLPEVKRDSLCRKLNRFADEVDRNRTRLDAFGSAFIGVCGIIGQGFENLEPARRWLDSIAKLLGHAKEGEDIAALPILTERKQLEPPRKEVAPHLGEVGFGEHDDIPF